MYVPEWLLQTLSGVRICTDTEDRTDIISHHISSIHIMYHLSRRSYTYIHSAFEIYFFVSVRNCVCVHNYVCGGGRVHESIM